ncbi:MAG TPA: type II secretion system protein GspM [Burkholderiaceae bacterium]|nr:type II secretion system protein GspM [Burkholderiaceae bacterium]
MLESLITTWRGMQTRERRIVVGGLGLLAFALLWLLAFEPAWVGRQRLQAELPKLRAQVSQMEGLAAEARRLSAQTPQGADTPQQLRTALERSIATAGLQGSVAQLTVAGELIDLRFKAAPFATWLAWFDTALRETRLRAVDIAIEREPAPGVVSARLTLEAQKREP